MILKRRMKTGPANKWRAWCYCKDRGGRQGGLKKRWWQFDNHPICMVHVWQCETNMWFCKKKYIQNKELCYNTDEKLSLKLQLPPTVQRDRQLGYRVSESMGCFGVFTKVLPWIGGFRWAGRFPTARFCQMAPGWAIPNFGNWFMLPNLHF